MESGYHTGRRLIVRLLIALAPMLVAILVYSNPPWFSSGTAPWACILPMAGMVLAFAALITPTGIALAVVAFLSPVVLAAIWLLAWLNWESGNDGGGFYWFLIIAPATALTGVLQWCMGLIILSSRQNRSNQTSMIEKEKHLERGPIGADICSGRWFSTPIGAALLVAALAVAVDLIARVIVRYYASSESLTSVWIVFSIDRASVAVKYGTLGLAPCICLRNPWKALSALGTGVAVGMLIILFLFLMMSGQALFGMSVAHLLQGLNTVLSGMILGYATAWAYGLRALRRTCLAVGALSGAIVASIATIHWYLADRLNAGDSYDEITTSLNTLSAFVLAVPLGVVIERHLRKQRNTPTSGDRPPPLLPR